MRGGQFARIDRLVLHGVIFSTTRHAVFVRAAISHWRLNEITVSGRRWCRPFQGGRIPGVVVFHLPSLPDAVEKVNDERDLRQAHDPRRNRDWGVPLEPT